MVETIFLIQGSIWTIGIVLLIYLLVKRLKAKKQEDFEDRDN